MSEIKFRWIAILVLGAAPCLVPACGGGDAGHGASPGSAPALGEAEIARARAVYDEQACGVCHGDEGEGSEAGPALRDLAPYWDVERLIDYLGNPEAFRAANPDFDQRRDVVYELEMPGHEHVPVDDRRLLARWLLER